MSVRPKPLRAIAEESALAAADVAFLSGLDEATISRLWGRQDWLDRIKGASLQALIAVVPGLGTYVCEYSLAIRRVRLFDVLEERGINVDRNVFRRLVESGEVPEQHLASVLDAAAHLVRGDISQAAAHVARFWGLAQDHALGFLYEPTDGLLLDCTPVVEASIAVADQLSAEKSRSFHAVIAQANLSHHIARTTGRLAEPNLRRAGDRQSALAYRSTVMGMIIETDDLELAKRYCREVEEDPVLSLIEEWAFPTYTRDSRPTSDLSVPRSLVMRNTAAEILREVDVYSDAYLYYLVTTGIPVVLHRDPTFGLQGPALKAAVERRLDGKPGGAPAGKLLTNLTTG